MLGEEENFLSGSDKIQSRKTEENKLSLLLPAKTPYWGTILISSWDS